MNPQLRAEDNTNAAFCWKYRRLARHSKIEGRGVLREGRAVGSKACTYIHRRSALCHRNPHRVVHVVAYCGLEQSRIKDSAAIQVENQGLELPAAQMPQ